MTSATKARAAGVGVVAVLALALVWARADAARFGAGDTMAVTAEVIACGSLRVEAGGEQWQSENQAVRTREGAIEAGDLLRRSENQAAFTATSDGLVVEMQRIRSDYFWQLGCLVQTP